MEKHFEKYVKEICSRCKNKNCENGKGIHISSYDNEILSKCSDYIPDKELNEKEGYRKPEKPIKKFKRLGQR